MLVGVKAPNQPSKFVKMNRFIVALVVLFLRSPGIELQAVPLKWGCPNVILFMADDQGMGDLSCLGNQVLRTPHPDRLYRMSTRFTDFHVSPTSAPTRSAVFSGRHEFRNRATHGKAG